ncbi:GDSL esterase/lipase At5g45910 [Lolium perenne]|uniref:GDSL esterase/lipase At5g45910 n=1 Tax=Lolium perenne TaxID=4522 RepID=UPI0021F5850A|nr:GDSL esterase/lipase At5g45910-like [Lolium perenne]
MKQHLWQCAVLLLFLLFAQSEPAVLSASHSIGHRRYGSIFSFGDSFADTGNKPIAFAANSVPVTVMRRPYGDTFFGHPTGRTTDGRLILDFLAENLGLPFVPPSLAHNGSFHRGANFAVAGATTLDADFFHDRNIPGAPSKFPLNTSLNVQLEWFEKLKPSLCGSTQECKEFLGGRSLFFVGEFGVNDYHLSLKKWSVEQVRSLVPLVIETISAAIERLIKHGATSLVVPGVIPSGCSPPILTMFADARPPKYDPKTGCLRAHNELGIHHNTLLQDSLRRLRAKHPGVTIVYADFFSPVMEMIESPHKFGFRQDVLQVCCGGPGRYNYNDSVSCGDPGATACESPSSSLYFDGVHLTEPGYRYVADGWLNSINSAASANTGWCRSEL